MSNLSPIKLTHLGDSIIATCMILTPPIDDSSSSRWKKFSIRCETPHELWDTVNAIHQRGADQIAKFAMGANFGLAASDTIHVDFNYIEAATKHFLAKGGTIRAIPPGASSFSTSKIDIASLLSELDKIPSTELTDELRATQSAETEHEIEQDSPISSTLPQETRGQPPYQLSA